MTLIMKMINFKNNRYWIFAQCKICKKEFHKYYMNELEKKSIEWIDKPYFECSECINKLMEEGK